MIPYGWQQDELGALVDFKSGGTPSKENPAYWGGDIPWISAKDLKKLFLDAAQINVTEEGSKNGARLVPPGTLLILVRGMTLLKDVPVAIATVPLTFNQDIKALAPNKGVNGEYLAYFLASRKSQLMNLVNQAGHGTGRLQTDLLKSFPVLLPPTGLEQDEIAKVIHTWDRAIDLTERLIAAKRERRRWLMQQLLTGQRRFPRFTRSNEMRQTRYGTIPSDWKYPQIGEIATGISLKNTTGSELPVLSCTKHHGLVDSLEYFGKRVFSKDLSTYKIVRRAQFAYATNHIDEGSIGYQDLYEEALISPMYTVFEAGEEVDDRFLFLLLKTELYRHIFEVNTSASVDRRGSLRWAGFAKIHIPLPPIDEQRAIIGAFELADRELAKLNNQLDALKNQKKGLMQQLLTGKVRVKVPAGAA